MARVHSLDTFMRSIGIKILYIIFVSIFTFLYTQYVVEDPNGAPNQLAYPFHRTLFISVVRIYGLFYIIQSLSYAAIYLFARLPPVHKRSPVDTKPGSDANSSEKKKGHLECLIIRIVTRGDYPKLIQRNVSYHVDLIEQSCTCDLFEIHVITQKPLHGNYQIGLTARVKEFLVPPNFKTLKGTLYKARNLVYWMQNCPADSPYPSKSKTWLISVDEDVLISSSFVTDFVDNFVPSGAHCGVLPPLTELDPDAGFFNIVEESAFMATQCTDTWFQCGILKTIPVWYRGAAYVIRRDVDEEIGYEYPPELSIVEDLTFSNYFKDSGYQIGYINGWYWEQGVTNLAGLIKQRAYWIRGFWYSLLYQRMSKKRRFRCAIKWASLFLVEAPGMALAILATGVWWTGYRHLVIPAGPRIWLDYIVPFGIATRSFSVVFGAWHLLPPKKAALITLCSFCWFGVIAGMAVHLAELVWTMYTLIEEYFKGRQGGRELTEKKEK